MSKSVGQPLARVEGRLKVTGAAPYAAEYPLDNLVYAVLVQSSAASGRIRTLDTTAARQVPGVLEVITHLNAQRLYQASLYTPWALATSGPATQKHLPLQDDQIYYSGQHIAVVLAETFEQATYAASLVKADYAADKPVPSMDAPGALATAYPPSPAVYFGVPADINIGSQAKGQAAGPVRIEQTYTTPTMHHNPMEPHATVAQWRGEQLTVFTPAQWVQGVQTGLAQTLGISKDQVQIVSPYIGGAFGSKAFWPHIILAAIAARQAARPVKLVLTRPQMFTSNGHRTPVRQTLRLHATRDGHLTAIRHTATAQTPPFNDVIPESSLFSTLMLYACPNISVSQRLVQVNTGTPWFMRAPGEATGVHALEVAMDELSYATKLDPVELRLRNYADQDPSTGLPWSSKSLKECYRQGAARIGWTQRTPAPRSMREGRYLIGYGMATATYPTLQQGATAKARLYANGVCVFQSATHDLGTGTYTVMTQVAADALGVDPATIRFEMGNSRLPTAPISAGAMTVASVGSAVQLAGADLQKQLIEMAIGDAQSPLSGHKKEEVSVRNGRMQLMQDPSRGETYAALLARGNRAYVEADGNSELPKDKPKYSMNAFGATFARVRVDEQIGRIHVTHFVGAYGAGRILNPKTAESQMLGGITFGLGMALMEETLMDPTYGRYVNASIGDYHVPVQADIPKMDIIFVDEVDPHINSLGAKGIGEIGNVGASAAIVNAVYHATGKRIRELPITPEKVM